jgi:HEAT repeat protein
VFRTPELAAELRRLRADGHSATAARITLDYGPLRDEAARAEDTPPESDPEHKPEPGADPAGPPGPLSHPELLNLARPHTDPNLIRRGLRQLAEPTPESAATLTPEEAATLLSALIHHPETRIRLLAHRTARSRLDRPSYLTLTTELLDDPEPNVIRSAARTLGHAAWHPAVPALIGLLTSRLPVLRAAAEEALELIGEPAVPALRHTAARARPDRRAHYTELLTRITSEDP